MENIIEANSLIKYMGSNRVIDNVSLKIEKGGIYGLVGEKSSGKTIVLKMIAGLSMPTHGKIKLFGEDVRRNVNLFDRIGYVIDEPAIFGNMTVYSNLKMKFIGTGNLKKRKKIKKRIEEIADLVELEEKMNTKVSEVALDVRQKLGIAMALVNEPDILLLDEIFKGLDREEIDNVRRILVRLNIFKGITIVITSDKLDELLKMASSYIVINNGQIAGTIERNELYKICDSRIKLRVDNLIKAKRVSESLNVGNWKVVDEKYILLDGINENITSIISKYVNMGIDVRNVSKEEIELDELCERLIKV